MAHVLISHGTCRVAWTEKGNFLSLLDLMRYAGVFTACIKKKVLLIGGRFHQTRTLTITVWRTGRSVCVAEGAAVVVDRFRQVGE